MNLDFFRHENCLQCVFKRHFLNHMFERSSLGSCSEGEGWMNWSKRRTDQGEKQSKTTCYMLFENITNFETSSYFEAGTLMKLLDTCYS
jgi:hypothetical protein